jgi:hypothetical protein
VEVLGEAQSHRALATWRDEKNFQGFDELMADPDNFYLKYGSLNFVRGNLSSGRLEALEWDQAERLKHRIYTGAPSSSSDSLLRRILFYTVNKRTQSAPRRLVRRELRFDDERTQDGFAYKYTPQYLTQSDQPGNERGTLLVNHKGDWLFVAPPSSYMVEGLMARLYFNVLSQAPDGRVSSRYQRQVIRVTSF